MSDSTGFIEHRNRAINRYIIAGNGLFLIALLSYFTVSAPLAYAIGSAGVLLEIVGVMQLVKSRR